MLRLLFLILVMGASFHTAPVLADSIWNHNGSEMRLRASGTTRTFTYEVPRSTIAAEGAARGTVLFQGSIKEEAIGHYRGTSFIFSARCGKRPYEVSGELRNDGKRIALTGMVPRIDRSTCAVKGSKVDELTFDFVSSDHPPVRYPPMVKGSICNVEEPNAYQACLEQEANRICLGRTEFEDLVRCFRAAVHEVYAKSEMAGLAADVVDTPFTHCHEGVCRMMGGGSLASCVRLDSGRVRECDGYGPDARCNDVQCPLRQCRKVCNKAE